MGRHAYIQHKLVKQYVYTRKKQLGKSTLATLIHGPKSNFVQSPIVWASGEMDGKAPHLGTPAAALILTYTDARHLQRFHQHIVNLQEAEFWL